MGRAEQQESLISALYSLSKELCFPLSSLGENGKHDRLKICSISRVIGSSPIVSIPGEIGKHDRLLLCSISRVIGSNPIASTDVSELVCWAGPWGLLACLLACGEPRGRV